MLYKAIVSQTRFLLKGKWAVCVFLVLFAMVIINFTENVLLFCGTDVIKMYHPMKLLLLSYNRTNLNATNTLLLIQLFPLLVVCPAGFALAKEYQLGSNLYLVSRLGNFKYLLSKYISVFLATAVVFTVPFLLEIILNCASFPMSATGDLLNVSVYDSTYRNSVNHYLMKNIYLLSPYLYAVLGTLLFGTVSGLLGVFTAVVSTFWRVKYNVVLFLPVFAVLNLLPVFFAGKSPDALSIRWSDYILIFNDEAKNTEVFVMGMLGMVFVAIGAAWMYRRKDCL